MLILYLLLTIITQGSSKYPLPKAAQEKANEILKIEFAAEKNLSIKPVSLEGFHPAKAGFELYPNQILQISKEDAVIGLLFFDKGIVFEKTVHFMVILNKDLSIRLVSVLIFEDEYGKKIAEADWLSKMIGHSSQNPLVYGSHPDAISGATVSAKMLTNGVNKILRQAETLRMHGII